MSFTDQSARWFLATISLAVILICSSAVADDADDRLASMGVGPMQSELPRIKIGGTPDDAKQRRKRSVDDSDDGDDEELEPLVRHGDNALPGTWRYQVALLIEDSGNYYFICGGTVLDKRHVMTAAHCLIFMGTYDYWVLMGTTNLTLGFASPHAQAHKVSDYKIHSKWTGNLEEGDIGMLYLDSTVVNNTWVQFAELAHPDMGLFSYYYCYITGWGFNEDWQIPDILQYAGQITLPKDRCQDYWAIAQGFKITDRLICARYYPRSICFGDSGGPLTCAGYVVGIASWVESFCFGCRPSGFTRVTFYYGWIQKALKKKKGYIAV